MQKSGIALLLFIPVLVLFLLPEVSSSQDFDQMRREIQERQTQARNDIEFLRREILRMEGQLSEAATEYQQRFQQFQQLEREISLRDQVLERLQIEQQEIGKELRVLQQAFDAYTKELNDLMDNYKTILRHLYMNGRESELMLLLTSGSLSEMQVRSYYLRKFQEFREGQVEQVELARARISEQEREMELAKVRNESSLAEASRERTRLNSRKQEQERLIASLQSDRQALEQSLAQSRDRVQSLNQLITQLIAEDDRIRREEEERYQQLERERLRRLAEAQNIENARDREREVARFSQPIRRPDAITLTDSDLQQIAQRFRSSRGRIPWPVDEGVVVTRFGNRVDPVYRTVIPNHGIEISTQARSPVRVVHDGFVSDVVEVHGYDTMIIVNHGDFRTVYGNLTQANVRRNSVVRAGDIIGLSGDESSYNGPVLFFLIRDGNRNVDPQQWITSRPGPVQ